MNTQSYSAHLVGFSSLGALAAYPGVGVFAGLASVVWAFWANKHRAETSPIKSWAVKLAGRAHIVLCALLQGSALYQFYSDQHALFGMFSAALILVISGWCVAYLYMIFPDGVPRKV